MNRLDLAELKQQLLESCVPELTIRLQPVQSELPELQFVIKDPENYKEQLANGCITFPCFIPTVDDILEGFGAPYLGIEIKSYGGGFYRVIQSSGIRNRKPHDHRHLDFRGEDRDQREFCICFLKDQFMRVRKESFEPLLQEFKQKFFSDEIRAVIAENRAWYEEFIKYHEGYIQRFIREEPSKDTFANYVELAGSILAKTEMMKVYYLLQRVRGSLPDFSYRRITGQIVRLERILKSILRYSDKQSPSQTIERNPIIPQLYNKLTEHLKHMNAEQMYWIDLSTFKFSPGIKAYRQLYKTTDDFETDESLERKKLYTALRIVDKYLSDGQFHIPDLVYRKLSEPPEDKLHSQLAQARISVAKQLNSHPQLNHRFGYLLER